MRKFAVLMDGAEELAKLLVSLGCPQHKSLEMAGMLEKRAGQLARQQGKTQAEALAHLLNLMKQGWAANAGGYKPGSNLR